DVHEDGTRPGEFDPDDCRNAGVRDGDNLVPRADADSLKGNRDGVRARGDANCGTGAAEGGEILLERLDLFAEDVAATREHPPDRRAEILFAALGLAP